jgi:hypothetical protein
MHDYYAMANSGEPRGCIRRVIRGIGLMQQVCEQEGYVREPGKPEALGQMYHHEGCGTMKYLRHRRQCGRNVGGERACESLRDPRHRRRGVIEKGVGREICNASGGMQQKWKRGGYARKPGRPEASAQRYDWQGCGMGGTMRNLMHRGECSRIEYIPKL